MTIFHNENIFNVFEQTYDCNTIIVPMGIRSEMNRGFLYDLSKKFPDVRTTEMTTPYGDLRKYGNYSSIKSVFGTFLMCYIKKPNNIIDYDLLEKCLSEIDLKFKGKNIATILFGQNEIDGIADVNKIIDIFDNVCNNITLHVYKYEQIDTKIMLHRKFSELQKRKRNKEITYNEYKEEKEKLDNKLKFGIY